jgi:hypothetical protein
METTATAIDVPRSGVRNLAGIAVRVSALWLFAGAFFKLFFGNPNLIPPLVREHTPFSLILTYEIAISIELAIVALAMLKPRVGWLAITPLFVFFLVLLGDMVRQGKSNCGCFGNAFELHPLVMMSIDAACLGFVLATRPWSAPFGRGAPWAAVGTAMAIGVVLPWIVIGDKSQKPADPGLVVTPGNGTTAPVPPADGGRKVWVEMHPERWTGQTVYDIAELTRQVPAEMIPTDGTIVFWRQSCDHCAAHLRAMASETDESKLILLVQVTDDMKASPAVDALPSGANVTRFALPEGPDYLVETPSELHVAGGVVQTYLDPKAIEALHPK